VGAIVATGPSSSARGLLVVTDRALDFVARTEDHAHALVQLRGLDIQNPGATVA